MKSKDEYQPPVQRAKAPTGKVTKRPNWRTKTGQLSADARKAKKPPVPKAT